MATAESGTVRYSRRDALGVLGTAGLAACQSSRTHDAHAEPAQAPSGGPPDGLPLQVVEVGDGTRVDDAIVVLHGWGAPGDDLVPLARKLARPGTRLFVPAAPEPEGENGRAWWHFDPSSHPVYAQSDAAPAGYEPRAAVFKARRAALTLLADVRQRYAPQRVALVGFSQGAMLALDVALHCEARISCVAVLSGALLVESLPALLAACPARPRVLISHGRQDRMVPFRNSELATAVLEKHGLTVDFRAFDGGHGIPNDIAQALPAFLNEKAD